MNSIDILTNAVTLLSVIGAYAPVQLLSVLNKTTMNQDMPYNSIFLRAEYTLDIALKNLDSAKSKAKESQALADGSNHLASLARKYTDDIYRDSMI